MPAKPTFVPSLDHGHSASSKRPGRNIAAISEAMRKTAIAGGLALQAQAPSAPCLTKGREHADIGLGLRELEDQRWSISPSLACQVLRAANLPYEGRRAGIIYSWRSIWRAEGLLDEQIEIATRQSHPELFENLLDTTRAAQLLGYSDSSSIRKIAVAGEIPASAYIKFGSRGVYRFRPAALAGLRGAKLGRVV